jgi:hypothetical protein
VHLSDSSHTGEGSGEQSMLPCAGVEVVRGVKEEREKGKCFGFPPALCALLRHISGRGGVGEGEGS